MKNSKTVEMFSYTKEGKILEKYPLRNWTLNFAHFISKQAANNISMQPILCRLHPSKRFKPVKKLCIFLPTYLYRKFAKPIKYNYLRAWMGFWYLFNSQYTANTYMGNGKP